MEKEKTLTFIKPEFLDIHETVIFTLERKLGRDEIGDFERLFDPVHVYPPKQLIEEHYDHVRHYPCFEDIVNRCRKQGVVLSAYMGEQIIQRTRNILGATDPSKAAKGTIRGDFGKGVLDPRYPALNVAHASGNQEDSEREFALWGKYYKHLFSKISKDDR